MASKERDESATAVQVCIRFRPLNRKEEATGAGSAWTAMPEFDTVYELGEDQKPRKDTGATFDKVYGTKATTEEVYAAVGAPLVENAMKGLHGTIFAYGQTSSGKTFTMQGDLNDTSSSKGGGGSGGGGGGGGGAASSPSSSMSSSSTFSSTPGFVELAAHQIFRYVASTPNREFLLRLSYIEIYNEEIRDLLQPDKKLGSHLKIHVNARSGPFVHSVSEVVTDAASMMAALRRGEAMREVSATGMNDVSSRSHTIFKLMVESKERAARRLSSDDDEDVDGAILESHLSFVDLAGSESVRHTNAEGTRLKEAGQINKSLLTLSRVIKQISNGTGHVNFRDSKLTHILQPSLAGNCKTVLVACATPAAIFREETRTTLAFAQRAKLIKTCAKINETLDEDCQLRRMKRDLQEAKHRQRELEEHLSQMQSGHTKQTHEELSALRDELQVTLVTSQEAQTAKEAADKKYENLKKLMMSCVMNAGTRKRDADAVRVRQRRRPQTMLPTVLLGIRGADFGVDDDDDDDDDHDDHDERDLYSALGLSPTAVAGVSPSLKKAKLQTEGGVVESAAALEVTGQKVQQLQFNLDVVTSKLETQTKRHSEAAAAAAMQLEAATARIEELEKKARDGRVAKVEAAMVMVMVRVV
jgi:centromeric protein E